MSIALALVGRPRLVVFDELTTGLDPAARRESWRLVTELRDDGVTVLLVTHYADEAERLCDRVALIQAGRLTACGRPAELIARSGVNGEPRHARRRDRGSHHRINRITERQEKQHDRHRGRARQPTASAAKQPALRLPQPDRHRGQAARPRGRTAAVGRRLPDAAAFRHRHVLKRPGQVTRRHQPRYRLRADPHRVQLRDLRPAGPAHGARRLPGARHPAPAERHARRRGPPARRAADGQPVGDADRDHRHPGGRPAPRSACRCPASPPASSSRSA